MTLVLTCVFADVSVSISPVRACVC